MKTFLMAAICLCSSAAFAVPAVQNGDRLLFLGEAAMQSEDRRDEYNNLVIDGLQRADITAHAIPMGSPTLTSSDMLRRMPAAVKKKTEWMILSCGLNDIRPGRPRVEVENLMNNVTAILDQAREAGIKVVIVTPVSFSETPGFFASSNEKTMNSYCEFLRREAADRKLLLADLNKEMQKLSPSGKNYGKQNLTSDGYHLNGYGNQMAAALILEAFGLPPEHIAKCRREWNKIPSMAPLFNSPFTPTFLITIEDYEVLRAEAAKNNLTPEQYSREIILEHIRQLKK